MEMYNEENPSKPIENGSTTQEVSADVDETFISPYNSPVKDYASASGDYNLISGKGPESDPVVTYHSVEPGSSPKGSTNFGNEMLMELQKVSQTNDRSCLFGGDALSPDCIKSDSGIALSEEKPMDCAKENHDDASEETQGVEICVKEPPLPEAHRRPVSSSMSSPEEEKDKIIAEMLATARKTKSNEELSQSEMASISKIMEEEFRTMVIEEQQKKKLMIEGLSRYGDLSHTISVSTTREPATKQSSEAAVAKPTTRSTKTTPTSRLPVTHSKIGRPRSAKRNATLTSVTPTSNKGSFVSPTSQRAISPTKPRCTPTTIRITSKAASPVTPPVTPTQSSSAVEQRTPLKPATLRIKTPSRIPSGTTPLKATLRSPLSALVTRTTPSSNLSTPRQRTPSSQSSETGKARMPDTKSAQSKIGSLQNANHTPGGGKVKIESKKEDYSKVTSKVGSKANLCHTPSGGKVKIESKKLNYSGVSSKCGSLANAKYTPGGGKVKIESKKLDFSHVSSKCGSLENASHTPGGGRVKVESKKLDFGNVSSKCGSRDNLNHTPRGGDVKIFSEKQNFSNVTGRVGSLANAQHTPGGGKVKIFLGKVDTSNVQSKIGSKDNLNHTPRGGKVKIVNRAIDLSHVKPKCGSLDNAYHVPGGGNVQIFDETLAFKESAKAKIGSLENASHVPKGGDIKIYDERLQFRETAAPRTDTGFNGLGSQGSTGSYSSTKLMDV